MSTTVISVDGQTVAFWGGASDFGSTDTYGGGDIFAAKLSAALGTAQQIFANQGGELTFLAKMALAAYHLDPLETVSSGVNSASTTSEDASFATVSSQLRMVSATDLPALALRATPDPNFQWKGLTSNGIYLNQNASALLGVASDALFISFRGTNDGTVGGLLGWLTGIGSPTYDQSAWSNESQYYNLFQEFVTSVQAYVAANGITKVYVSGHSLGGAIAQEFMAANLDNQSSTPSTKYEAITFGDIGFAGDYATDPRIRNVIIDGEAANLLNGNGVHSVLLPTQAHNPVAGPEYIIQNPIAESLTAATDIEILHSDALQLAVAQYLDQNYAGLPNYAAGNNHINIALNLTQLDGDAWSVGALSSGLYEQGSGANDVFLGDFVGEVANTLDGMGGRDQIVYKFAASTFSVSHKQNNTWTIAGNGFTDTLSHIEQVRFSDKTIALRELARLDSTSSGYSDILWRNASNGAVVDWTMNGASVTGSGALTNATTYTIVGTGDFNGDGTSDILWRNASTGGVAMWNMSGNTVIGTAAIGGDTTYDIVGTADFDGNGLADILWRNNATGVVQEWTMNGGALASATVLGGTGYTIVGTGDYNADGDADILWRNDTSGSVVEWNMNGGAVLTANTIGGDTTWSVVGSGDFNGDGHADVLWRNGMTGSVVEWLMGGASGNQVLGSSGIGGDTTWSVHTTGDFNNDGRADILWRNGSSGTILEWLMNGSSVTASNVIAGGDANWRPVTV